MATSTNPIIHVALQTAKRIVFKHSRFGAPQYPYLVEPIVLATLVMEFERLKDVRGSVVEIGVARGMTTRFLCEHMAMQQDMDIDFYAIDTFESFIEKDVIYEIKQRGKSRFELWEFDYNDYGAWQRNFSKFGFLKPIKTDCSTFDYSSIAPIKLAFLDVDLYMPTIRTLPVLFESLSPGGAILVDDVRPNNRWDGAFQAYMEFCESRKITPHILGTRCGVIYRH